MLCVGAAGVGARALAERGFTELGDEEDSLTAAGQAQGVTTARRGGTAAGASIAAERSASATSTRAARGRGGGAARPTCRED